MAAMGFCLLANVAVAARYAQAVHGAERVLIVDLDVHHGNGTQEAFYEDPSVLFVSSHQGDIYPGTGHLAETGAWSRSPRNFRRHRTLVLPCTCAAPDEVAHGGFDQLYALAISLHSPPRAARRAQTLAHTAPRARPARRPRWRTSTRFESFHLTGEINVITGM